jgi:hypothetical protein
MAEIYRVLLVHFAQPAVGVKHFLVWDTSSIVAGNARDYGSFSA